MSKYPSKQKQIEEFGVWVLFCGKLHRIRSIQTLKDYNHSKYHLHHYILEQEYYANPERYKDEQKLILLETDIHADLHSAMSDKRFYNKWKIEKDVLWKRHRKVD